MSATVDLSTGARIAYWRKRRGLSQTVLANLAGFSQSYLSLVEIGARQVERRSTLVAFANALQVSVAELTGQPGDPTDPAKARAVADVPAVRTALIMRKAGIRRDHEHVADVDTAIQAIANTDYATLGPLLPGLIGTAAGPDLVQVGYAASSHLHYTGYSDLAREVASLALDEARDRDDPAWIGVAEYVNVTALPADNADVAVALAGRAADTVQPHLADPTARQAYGMLHLTMALRSALLRRADDALAHLDEAAAEAETLGELPAGGVCAMAFGPTNVQIWRLAVLGELGDHERGVAVAADVHPEQTPVGHRQASYWIDYGHMLAALNRDAEAVAAFLRAESICPQWIRLRRSVRDSIAVILRRTRRNAVSRPLQHAAEIVGLHSHLN